MTEGVEAAAKSMVWMLTTLDRTVIHISAMRRSMERLELYMLAMVGLMYGLVLFSVVGGLLYYYFGRRSTSKDDYRRHMSTSSMINASKKSRASMVPPNSKHVFREEV